MGKHINEAVKNAMTRAALWDARVSCLDRWASEARRGPHEPGIDYQQLRTAMMNQALDAWRDAMMWGLVSDEHKAEVKQEAANRFLRMDGSTRSVVMHHLDAWGSLPGRYESAVEEQFRAEIRLALNTVPEVEE